MSAACGTRAAYNAGCRCDDCRRAQADYAARRNHGTRRDALSVLMDHCPPPPGEWVARAACRGTDPNLFHPSRGESLARVKAICGACPVAGDCLAYALDNRITCGIWGGMSERQRRELRRQRKTVAA